MKTGNQSGAGNFTFGIVADRDRRVSYQHLDPEPAARPTGKTRQSEGMDGLNYDGKGLDTLERYRLEEPPYLVKKYVSIEKTYNQSAPYFYSFTFCYLSNEAFKN